MLLVRLCNLFPNHLVDNLLVCSWFACTSQPTAFGAESADTDTAGFAFDGCELTLLLLFSSAVRGQVDHFFSQLRRCPGFSKKAAHLKEKCHSCPF